MVDKPATDTLTEEELLANLLYWQSKTPAERVGEGWRLSVEHYGLPKGDLRDGPVQKVRINSNGTEEVINECCGPNPLRHD